MFVFQSRLRSKTDLNTSNDKGMLGIHGISDEFVIFIASRAEFRELEKEADLVEYAFKFARSGFDVKNI